MVGLKKVYYSYNKVNNVLTDLTLDVPKGVLASIVGDNGVGKSTLLKLVATILEPIQGKIVFFDDSSIPIIKIRRRLNYVPQESCLLDELSVEDNLRYFCALYGYSKQIATSTINGICEMIEIPKDMLSKKINHLSGGFKKRANIACSLVNKPELLIIDEPTQGLDYRSREMVLNLLAFLKAEGCTIIFTSHYLEEVKRVSDLVYRLENGIIKVN